MKNAGKGVEKREHSYYNVGGNVSWYSHYGELVWSFLKKMENRVAIWFRIPTTGHIYGENYNLKRYMHPNIHSSTVYNSQDTGTI